MYAAREASQYKSTSQETRSAFSEYQTNQIPRERLDPAVCLPATHQLSESRGARSGELS